MIGRYSVALLMATSPGIDISRTCFAFSNSAFNWMNSCSSLCNTLSLQQASKECVDFVNKLVVPDEKKRLVASKLSKHKWFNQFDFDALKRGAMPAPFADVVQKRMENLYAGMDEFPHRHHQKMSVDGVVKDLLDTIQSK